MKKSEFRNLIKTELIKEAKGTSYEAKLSEIEKQGQITTLEAKIDAIAEMIEAKNSRLNLVSEDENLSELIDKKKIKEMQKEIKNLEKTKLKLEKLYEKKTGGKKKEMVDEDASEDSSLDDVAVGVTDEKEDVEEGYSKSSYEEDDLKEIDRYRNHYDEYANNISREYEYDEDEDETMNEEFNRFKKLAGIPLKEESELRIYSIVKDSDPFDFGPYTKEVALRKAEELNREEVEKEGGFGVDYFVEPYNTMRDRLSASERMHIPKIDKYGNLPTWDDDRESFSAGDLADY